MFCILIRCDRPSPWFSAWLEMPCRFHPRATGRYEYSLRRVGTLGSEQASCTSNPVAGKDKQSNALDQSMLYSGGTSSATRGVAEELIALPELLSTSFLTQYQCYPRMSNCHELVSRGSAECEWGAPSSYRGLCFLRVKPDWGRKLGAEL